VSTLQDALVHPANGPRPLVEWLASLVSPSADLSGLTEHGGVIRDFRAGLEENDPSLSVSRGTAGTVVHRFGADGFQGGAVDFVVACLEVTKGEAARLLVERAGLVDTLSGRGEGNPFISWKPIGKKAVGLDKARASLAKLTPLPEDKGRVALRGWVRLEAGEHSPEALELARRGLTPALASGLLIAYRWTGEVGSGDGPKKRIALPRHILPGALAFEVVGPDGMPWAIKARNPGDKAALQAVGAQRYVYVTAGQSTPAFCGPGQRDAERSHLIVEGELNAVACVAMLDAAGVGEAWAIQGVASASALPHVSHIPAGARVYLYADPDAEGEKARTRWGEVLAAQGTQVFQLAQEGSGQASPFAVKLAADGAYLVGADACDASAPGHMPAGHTPDTYMRYRGHLLTEALAKARPWFPTSSGDKERAEDGKGHGDVWLSKRSGYGMRNGKLCALSLKKNDDGEEYEAVEVLAEFTATITAEVEQEDGTDEAGRVFEITGTRPDGRPMNPARVTVTAAEFAAMTWPVTKWGAAAIVHAGQGKKDKARAAIQLLSQAKGVAERTVYQHIGWIAHPEHGPLYLTAGSVIGKDGAVEGVDVELGGRLREYALPEPPDGATLRQAVMASLELLRLAPASVAVPVLGAVYRAPLGQMDAALWLTGETGRNKTAFLGLAQSHYGAGWNRRYLPDGWNSTANALERAAFVVKDAVFLIDDFKPAGNTSDTARAYANVARILQGVADGQGRGTLTADRRARQGLYPRGLVASSAETLPRGHSNRARTVVVEVTEPLIGKDRDMSALYYAAEDRAADGVYAQALAGYVRFLAGCLERLRVGSPAHKEHVRRVAPHFEGEHGRTGVAAAELSYGWRVFLSFAVVSGGMTSTEARRLWNEVVLALRNTASGQATHLASEDPVTRATAILSGLLAQGRVYVEDLEKGGPPDLHADLLGWEWEPGLEEREGRWKIKSGAMRLGWWSRSGGDEWMHLLPDALHEQLQAVATRQGTTLPDASTLWANMRDRYHPAGLMRCEEEKTSGRIRPFYKVTVSGLRQRLLTFRCPLDLDTYSSGTMGTLGTDDYDEAVGLRTLEFVPLAEETGTPVTTWAPQDEWTVVV
jgi:hypothetical protein